MLNRIILLYIILSSILLATPVKTNHVELELISEVASIQPGKPFWLGVRFNLVKDWHIYWRNPGDAGMAPKFKWTLPENFTIGETQWPYPERSITTGLASFIYSDQVLLMMEVTPPGDLTEGTQVPLQVRVDWLECNEVCLPGEADLLLNLPVRDEVPLNNAVWQEIFTKSRAKIPVNKHNWEIKAFLADSTVNLLLNAAPGDVADIKSMEFFPYVADEFKNAARQYMTATDEGYRLILYLSPTLLQLPDRISGILVVDEGRVGPNTKKAIIIDLPLMQNSSVIISEKNYVLNYLWILVLLVFITFIFIKYLKRIRSNS